MSLAKTITTFEGVFCSGFFIPDQRYVTALALLFDKIHFLNQLEHVIEFSKRYSIKFPGEHKTPEMRLTPASEDEADDPLKNLTEEQKATVFKYLFLSDQFFLDNALLFPSVFKCSLLPDGEVLSVKLVEKGMPGQLNKYQATKNPLMVATDAGDEFSKLLSGGRVPVLLSNFHFPTTPGMGAPNAQQIAANIALNTVAMVLPGTRAAEAGEIMEAREKLSDHLPSFWSSMLKLSSQVTAKIDKELSAEEIQNEIQNLLSTTVKPALIDLVEKLEKERKTKFRKILTAGTKGLRVLAGKPPTDLAGLISGSLLVGADASIEFANHLRNIEALKQESGMSYLIELDKHFT